MADFVTGFYNNVLARTPAPSEVVAWADFLLANPTPAAASAMAHGFLDGPEFLSKARTHAQFVTILYRVFLEREPDGPGLAGWVGNLLDGFDTALPGFVNSQEFRSLLPSFQDRTRVDAVVLRLYVEVLGRTPNPSELSAWTDYIVATGDLLGVARGFLRCRRVQQPRRTLAQHVVILYRTFLGRDPAPSEIGPWVDYIQSFPDQRRELLHREPRVPKPLRVAVPLIEPLRAFRVSAGRRGGTRGPGTTPHASAAPL